MKRITLITMLFVAACASIPIKQQAAQSLQASEAALGGAQDLERSLCFNNPQVEKGSHCTNPAAVQVKLTDDLHVKFAQKFEHAFGVQLAAATEVETWQPGQPAPSNFSLYSADVQDVLGLAQALTPATTNAGQLLAKAQAAVTSATQIAALFGVK